MVQPAIMVREHRERRVVAHGDDGFLGFLDHRLEHQLEVFHEETGRHLAAAQVILLEDRRLAARRLMRSSMTVMFFTQAPEILARGELVR